MFVYFHPRFFKIFILAIICGLPLSLPASTLVTMLTEQGLNLTTIGLFAFVGLPYSLKFLWAPIVDNFQIPILHNMLGRRRSWMLVCQILTFCAIFSVSIFDAVSQLYLIALSALLIVIFSVTNDIVFDAYRIESLKPEDQAAGASVYVFGYRLGMLVSSAGALYIAHFYSWGFAYITMALVMPIGLLTVLFSSEPKSYRQLPANQNFKQWLQNAYLEPLAEFINRLNAWQVLVFIVLFKLGDAFAGMMTNPFLLSIGFTKIDIANIVKGIGLIATLSGVFCGGILAKQVNMTKCLVISIVLQSVSNLLFLFILQTGYNNLALSFVICIENFVGGVGTTILMAYLAMLCNIRYTATQFALLSSLASSGRTLISGSGGFVADTFGWSGFFIISAMLSLPALLLVNLALRKKQGTSHAERLGIVSRSNVIGGE